MGNLKPYILALFVAFASLVASAGDGKFVVVIDPGHGGHDSGCVGVNTKEKDVVLGVSKLLRDKIENAYGKEVEVVMTRSTDKFIELNQRAKIANDAHGDIFISIHVNSVDKKTRGRENIRGASVYTCGLHKSQNNLQVAMRENSVMELEPDYSTRYHGFDPNSSESYIMFELSQSLHQQQSISLAQIIEDELIDRAGRLGKGVKQAGFWVLWSTAMPSVLVELDYMCNPTQEKFLKSSAGQEKCADALFSAFEKYYKQQSNRLTSSH